MSADYVLSIDQGTTGTAVMVFDREGALRGRAYSEFTQYYPEPGWVEHDANEIWAVSKRVVAQALEQTGVGAQDIAAIGITNQRETTLVWDRNTGEPVGRAIVWQDRRTAAYCDELKRRGLERTIQGKTGLVVDPYFSGTKVKWLLDNIRGLRSRAEGGDLAFGTIDSWLVWHLTGGQTHITDYSNASRTLLYDIRRLTWDDDLLELFDIPPAILPTVKPSSCVYGYTDPQVFFGQRVPVAGVAGDQQAALFGQACYGEGRAKNTYGTGSFVMLNTGREAADSQENLLSTIAWGIGDEAVEYALEGAIFTTGAAVQWLRDGLGIIDDAAETETLAWSVDSNDGVYFAPALAGLGAPHWDPYARGMLIGVTRGTGRAHVARAVLESICYQTVDIIRAMERDSGIALRELRCDGGACVNAFLMQFQADMLGVPVEVPKITETTGLGAAYLAGLAIGFWRDRAEIDAKWQLARRFEPTMSTDQREHLYARWLKALERCRGWALNDV